MLLSEIHGDIFKLFALLEQQSKLVVLGISDWDLLGINEQSVYEIDVGKWASSVRTTLTRAKSWWLGDTLKTILRWCID